jgi:cyclic pyranopterin phosphate synthase
MVNNQKNLSYLTPIKDSLGRPLKDLRISVMDRCNFRCTYCMPEEKYHPKFKFLPSNQRLSFDNILRITKNFVSLGVDKIRITGGEPLLRVNLTELIGDLSRIDGIQDIALTTNGVLLSKYASELKAAGLDRITVSLDSIDPNEFKIMTGGRGSLDRVLAGIEEAKVARIKNIKVNAVIKRGINDQKILKMVEHFRSSSIILRFIEYMDVGNINHWKKSETVPSQEIFDLIQTKWPMQTIEPNYQGEVASRYQFKDGKGELGFISSVTKPFCGSCSRARLSSDGKLYNCLFASNGKDIKPWLTEGLSDHEIQQRIFSIWSERADRYSELRAQNLTEVGKQKVEMYYIGG